MITTIISDFARVILFARDSAYRGSLTRYYQQLAGQQTSIWDSYHLNKTYLAGLQKYQPQLQLVLLTASSNLPQHSEIQPKLRNIFDPILLTAELNLRKDLPACYTTVCQQLEKQPDEVIFVDDSQTNIMAAKQAGLHTVQFTDTTTALKQIATIINDHSSL